MNCDQRDWGGVSMPRHFYVWFFYTVMYLSRYFSPGASKDRGSISSFRICWFSPEGNLGSFTRSGKAAQVTEWTIQPLRQASYLNGLTSAGEWTLIYLSGNLQKSEGTLPRSRAAWTNKNGRELKVSIYTCICIAILIICKPVWLAETGKEQFL